jgi:YesN/AraC family two-component response regulator
MEINVSKLKEYGSIYQVLYVEDDALIRSQTLTFLRRFFSNVDVAEDGALGLEKYKNFEYDIVITDINMPNMNGIEMIEKIKEIDEGQIILVTSAHNDSENLLRLINLNIMRFILKPFDFKQFLIMLYRVVEELYTKTQIQKMQKILYESSQTAQKIVDTIDIGLVMFENAQLKMANQAFLKMYGFDDFKTLQLELPEIGVLFQDFKSGIDAQTNAELIQELKTRPSAEQRVRISQGRQQHEYQVKMTILDEEKEECIVSFTDISALHQRLTQDIHTKLPHRQAVLGLIESLATVNERLYCYFISVNHYDSLLKWYGKADAIAVEAEASDKLKALVHKEMKEAEIGYFGTNQYIVFQEKEDDSSFAAEVKKINFEHNKKVNEKDTIRDKNFHLSACIQKLTIDLNKPRDLIEVAIINAFDNLQLYCDSSDFSI